MIHKSAFVDESYSSPPPPQKPPVPLDSQDGLLMPRSPDPVVADFQALFPEILCQSQSMHRLLEDVAKIARSDSSVLLLGESGTGKELVASAIHRLSPRSHKRFVALNCSAIPEDLLESEFFGHEKGAFSGAVNRRVGHFEIADGGTIFLDEIGDMPQRLQSKLLRVLQERQFTPVGSNILRQIDVRVIAATNVDLSRAVHDKNFRLDLYYRLDVLRVSIPPLRDRRTDIPLLLTHFLNLASRMQRLEYPCRFSPSATEVLINTPWPGNVRQLQNLVERLVVLKGQGGMIDLIDLPEELLAEAAANAAMPPAPSSEEAAAARFHASVTALNSTASHMRIRSGLAPSSDRPVVPLTAGGGALPLALPLSAHAPVTFPDGFGKLPDLGIVLPRFIEDLENSLIRQALERTNNNKNQAAKLLGLNRTTLVERIKKRGISDLAEPSREL